MVTGEGTDQVPGATRANGSMFADTLIGPPVGGTVSEAAQATTPSATKSGELYGGPGDDMLTGVRKGLLEGGRTTTCCRAASGRNTLNGAPGTISWMRRTAEPT